MGKHARLDAGGDGRQLAFTLVELLVVMSVIAILMGLVIAGVGRIRAQAERVECGARLRNWGMVIASYATDRRGALPIPLFYDRQSWDSSMMWFTAPPAPVPGNGQDNMRNEINFPALEPYLGTGQDVAAGLKQLAREYACPEFMRAGGLLGSWPAFGGEVCGVPGYMLLTGADDPRVASHWQTWNFANSTFIGLSSLNRDGSRVIMSDSIWAYSWGGPVYSQAFHRAKRDSHTSSDVPIQGGHILLQDGSVLWRRMGADEQACVMSAQKIPAGSANNWGHIIKSAVGWSDVPGSIMYIPRP